jgi:hypothetical protein
VNAETATDALLQRFRVDLELAPLDASLHRVLADCHRRHVTIDSLQYTRSTSTHRIVMEILTTPPRAEFISHVLGAAPLVLRCTTSLTERPARQGTR